MGRLLKFEFRKLFRQKSFYICGIIMIGLILMSTLTMKMMMEISQTMSEVDGVTISMTAEDYGLSGISMMASALSNSNLSIILAVFIALFVCSDYVNGTLKNVIAKGYGRIPVFASKYIVSLIAATIYTLLCWLIGFLSGAAFWGVGSVGADSSTWEFISILLLQLLSAYAYTSMFFFISAIFKKTGGAISVGIIGPLVILMILGFVDAFINSETFSVADYWLDSCFVDVLATSVAPEVMTRCLICFLIYTLVFTVGGHLIGRRSEV